MNKIYLKDDLNKHLRTFVVGHCCLWNDHAKQFTALDLEFYGFVNRTLGVCHRYLNAEITLDGSCSDFECVVASEAKAVFHDHLLHCLQRDYDQLVDYNNTEAANAVKVRMQMIKARA